jgi:hypothetical protein
MDHHPANPVLSRRFQSSNVLRATILSFEADYSLSIALLICLLSDGNSIFQVSGEQTFKFYFWTKISY